MHWTANSHASQPSFPGGDHFTAMPFIRHNSNVVYWRSGILASSQLEPLAELGLTTALVNLAKSDSNTDGVNTTSGFAAVDSRTINLIVHKDYPLITSATMIAPSPDWFTGVRNLSLIKTDSTDPYWLPSVVVPLLGYDAGTEDGIRFSLSNPDSNPKQLIHLLSEDAALKAAGFNIVEPFGTITFSLQSVAVDATDTATWSAWSQWSPANNADISVMTIMQTRSRSCGVTVNGNIDDPAATCSGSTSTVETQTQTVTNPLAADTATWSAWSQWSPADNANSSVITIMQTRTRSCGVTVNGNIDDPAATCSGSTSTSTVETQTQTVANCRNSNSDCCQSASSRHCNLECLEPVVSC